MDPLTLAAGGLSALGGLFKGITGMLAGTAQQKALDYAARQAEDQAGVSAQQQLDQGNQVAARAAAQGAANGGGFVGSTLGLVQDLASRAMFNTRAEIYKGKVQAQNDIYQGQVARAQGLNDMIGGVVDAGSSLVGGFAKAGFQAQQLKYMQQAGGDFSGAAGVTF